MSYNEDMTFEMSKTKYSFDDFEFKERRSLEFSKIKERYPMRIPVVVEKANDKHSKSLPDLDQNKYNLE